MRAKLKKLETPHEKVGEALSPSSWRKGRGMQHLPLALGPVVEKRLSLGLGGGVRVRSSSTCAAPVDMLAACQGGSKGPQVLLFQVNGFSAEVKNG
jgi:hypothetical protein